MPGEQWDSWTCQWDASAWGRKCYSGVKEMEEMGREYSTKYNVFENVIVKLTLRSILMVFTLEWGVD